jgi:hypothetical protein
MNMLNQHELPHTPRKVNGYRDAKRRRRAARIARGEHPKGNGANRMGDVLSPEYIRRENHRATGELRYL